MAKHSRSVIELIRQHCPNKPLWGAEIGVWRGQTAEAVLAAISAVTLLLVDAYLPAHECPGDISAGQAGAEAWGRTQRFQGRVAWAYMLSEHAARFVAPASLDFVFIDASHDYQSVALDLDSWTPKVKAEGLVCGHDYHRHHPGVRQAVDERFGDNVAVAQGNVWWVIRRTAGPRQTRAD